MDLTFQVQKTDYSATITAMQITQLYNIYALGHRMNLKTKKVMIGFSFILYHPVFAERGVSYSLQTLINDFFKHKYIFNGSLVRTPHPVTLPEKL